MASIIWMPVIFISATCFLYFVATNAPKLDDHDGAILQFPSNLEELKDLSLNLNKFHEVNSIYVYFLFSIAYIYKQTFAIPGSLFMNLLAGALFGVAVGFPLACILSAIGASHCYLLSKYFGKSHVVRFFPEKVSALQSKVEENKESLLYFLLFIRIFPMTPNWLLNICSPIINIPLGVFFLSVLLGLMPYNFICVQTGVILSELSSLDNIFKWEFMGKLMAIAVASLLPAVIKKWNYKSVSDK